MHIPRSRLLPALLATTLLAACGGGDDGPEEVRPHDSRTFTVNEAGLAGVLPDLVAVLSLPADRALSRQDGLDRIGGAGAGFQQEVAEAYLRLAAEDPGRVRLIDATRPVPEVVDEIMGLLG